VYGFPSDFDPSAFVGRELSSVTYVTNVIVLEFDDLVVSVFAEISYRTSSGGESYTESPPAERSNLIALLGRTVIAANLPSSRELNLELERGGLIRLVDGSEPYESFLFKVSGREFIV